MEKAVDDFRKSLARCERARQRFHTGLHSAVGGDYHARPCSESARHVNGAEATLLVISPGPSAVCR